ncbi:MAG: hypothetical protein LBT37_06390 [Lactobacillaceae bacterium]|nr:hypothetical protein [Lactobacillaceae bacterium]
MVCNKAVYEQRYKQFEGLAFQHLLIEQISYEMKLSIKTIEGEHYNGRFERENGYAPHRFTLADKGKYNFWINRYRSLIRQLSIDHVEIKNMASDDERLIEIRTAFKMAEKYSGRRVR